MVAKPHLHEDIIRSIETRVKAGWSDPSDLEQNKMYALQLVAMEAGVQQEEYKFITELVNSISPTKTVWYDWDVEDPDEWDALVTMIRYTGNIWSTWYLKKWTYQRVEKKPFGVFPIKVDTAQLKETWDFINH